MAGIWEDMEVQMLKNDVGYVSLELITSIELTLNQRAAPPGRCHSCNRAETPEWRRGPDGARTLCNACGLHYAKLTRKLGSKQAQNGGPALRPSSMGDVSPRS